jgi:gluconolactonase
MLSFGNTYMFREDMMKKLALLSVAFAALAFAAGHAQAPQAAPPQNTQIERFDPAFDALITPETKAEILHQDEGAFFEGPIWHHGKDGSYLTFSDLVANRIDKWDPKTKQVTTYMADIWTGKDNTNAIAQERNGKKLVQVGANGQTLDKQGRLVFVAMGSGKVVRREADGKLTTLADSYEGHHLNAPNDLVIKSDGAIYFTDIRANTKSTDFTPPDGVPHTGVYRIKDGTLTLLVKDLEAPNGIAFSPDEKALYVNDIRTKKLWRYDVTADGGLANGKVLVDMNSDPRPGNPDGMKVDVKGNIWDGGPGGIWVISPQGKHLGTVPVPERISNLAWGDDDGKTLYTTSGTQVTRIRVNVAGLRP